MKSYSCYFVRTAELEKARTLFAKVEVLPDSDWLMCGFRADDSPPEDEVLCGEESLTEAKSKQLGEVIFVYGDTSIDGFAYEHSRNGQLLRKLVWFALLDDDWTSGWVCVTGETEDWEATLFNANNLAQCLEYARQKLEDEGREEEFTELEAEIQQTWQLKQIVAGKTYPYCDGTVALLVERSYGIKR